MTFNFSNYSKSQQAEANEQFLQYILDELLATPLDQLATEEQRVQEITDLTEAYFSQFGEPCTHSHLYYLGNYLLLSHLKDGSSSKRTAEGSVLSWSQLRNRKSHELLAESKTVDWLHTQRIHNFPKRRTTNDLKD